MFQPQRPLSTTVIPPTPQQTTPQDPVHSWRGERWPASLPWCSCQQGGRKTTDFSVSEPCTHTERYIPYHSHHPTRATMGVLRCMHDRARSICHPTKMQQEMDHLNQVFQANGFPENLVKKTLMTHPPPLPETSEPEQLDEAPKILCTPYIKG